MMTSKFIVERNSVYEAVEILNHAPLAKEIILEGVPIYEEKDSTPKYWREEVKNDDNVNHPRHYNTGKIEVIEAIEDWKLGFHTGNAIKYVARAGFKDPGKYTEDLEKAIWYLRREIKLSKSETEGRNSVRPNDMPQERAK